MEEDLYKLSVRNLWRLLISEKKRTIEQDSSLFDLDFESSGHQDQYRMINRTRKALELSIDSFNNIYGQFFKCSLR